MISLLPPMRLKVGDFLAFVVFPLAALLFAPDSAFARTNVNWLFGLVFLLPVMFVVGLISSWLYYRKHDLASTDPFYIRAWWTMVGGAIAWPACLLFRQSVADFAFILFTFGAGPVIAFHVYRRSLKHKQA